MKLKEISDSCPYSAKEISGSQHQKVRGVLGFQLILGSFYVQIGIIGTGDRPDSTEN
jgi:hypothetical protein